LTAEAEYPPIEDHGIIGDCRTCALVSSRGSIDWACFPRFDSPSVFARLLDASEGGHWQIQPTAPYKVRRSYLPDTNVLSTTFVTGSGEVELLDFMPVWAGASIAGGNAIIRVLRGRRGTVECQAIFAPRFDYARTRAEWSTQASVGIRAIHGQEALTLYSHLSMELVDGGHEREAHGTCTVREGDELVSLLTYRSPLPLLWKSDALKTAARQLGETIEFWRHWIGLCTYEGHYHEPVRRSALVLKLLDYAPTGAMIAAPTTSLPEHIGGVRNWDYRYAWIRDTAFVLYGFYLIGYQDEGENFFQWVLDLCREKGVSGLQIMYGIGGERRLDEFELDHLEGYRGSRPVRVGNAAYEQKQLDIYGDLVDCAFLAQKYGRPITEQLWPFLREVVERAAEVWTQADYGIWEVRSEQRHFLYSKAMCWVAMDRGIKLAERAGLPADLERWKAVRAAIMEEIRHKGWNEEARAFTQSYGITDLDAAALALLLRKVLPADDPQMRSTVDRIAEGLGADGIIHRYLENSDDGLPGGEGAFLMCCFWLVDCYALMGRAEDARELFERLLGLASPLGLYAEQLDEKDKHHLGNFPQAFTHVALINAAVSLARAEAQRAGDGPPPGAQPPSGEEPPGRSGAST
jgi:GH15 family glucan-1,4-alpha-glucosidase